MDLDKIIGFEWDKGNIDKSYKKHGVTLSESEEVFLDENILVQEDIEHSEKEKRLRAIGRIIQGDMLFAVFTVRDNKIRIISIRKANEKERRLYEQKS